MTKTKDKYLTMRRKMVLEDADAWFGEQIEALERGIADLKRRRAAFNEVCDPEVSRSRNVSPVEILSWGVNDIQNIARNLRLDTAVNHAAALVATNSEPE